MIELIQGDCLQEMQNIPDKSVDLILCDLPYGTTACSWDEIIPFKELWEQYENIIRPNGYIVLFCSQPFTSKLIYSNIDNFSHQWVWDKDMCVNPYLVKKQPIKNFEDIAVFCFNYDNKDPRRKYFKKVMDFIGKPKSHIIKETNQGLDHCFRIGSKQFDIPTKTNYDLLIKKYNIDNMNGFLNYNEIDIYKRTYNPKMEVRGEKVRKGYKGETKSSSFLGVTNMDTTSFNNEYYPRAILKISNRSEKKLHPTQKPVELLRYLIETYSNDGDLVMDNTMGSGSTAIACIETNRNFIGIELDEHYFAIAKKRVEEKRKEKENTPQTLFDEPN